MPTYSHSRIDTFEKCPLQYKFAYIDRVDIERVDTVEAFLGSCVHEALEKLYQDKRFEKTMSLDDLTALFRRIWEKGWKDSIVIVKQDYTPSNYARMGERYLADYYRRHFPFDEGKILGLETQKLLSLDEEGTVKYHVRIDRLVSRGEGLYEIHDYKTGMKLPTQEELDRDRQLAMYSLWVREQFKDFREGRLVWHYLAFDQEMDSVRTEKQLEALRFDVLEKIRRIEQSVDFPPCVSSLCPWCLYQDICPEWKHEKEVEKLTENEFMNDPGVKLVDEYVRIKEDIDQRKKSADQQLAKLKEAIIAFCGREGVTSLSGSNRKIGVRVSESVKLPAKNTNERDELVDILRQSGKWDQVSDLDIHALARIMQEESWEPALLDRLRNFTTIERSTRLSIKKKRE